MGRTRIVVGVLVGALAFYFALIGYRGWFLLGQPRWVDRWLGAAVLILPLIGIWVVVAEIRFGRAAQRLTDELGPSDGGLELPRRPSGRVDRDAADAVFVQQRAAVQDDPRDWRGWYRLGEAYDAAGDRRRARDALRTAIARHDRPMDYDSD